MGLRGFESRGMLRVGARFVTRCRLWPTLRKSPHVLDSVHRVLKFIFSSTFPSLFHVLSCSPDIVRRAINAVV